MTTSQVTVSCFFRSFCCAVSIVCGAPVASQKGWASVPSVGSSGGIRGLAAEVERRQEVLIDSCCCCGICGQRKFWSDRKKGLHILKSGTAKSVGAKGDFAHSQSSEQHVDGTNQLTGYDFLLVLCPNSRFTWNRCRAVKTSITAIPRRTKTRITMPRSIYWDAYGTRRG